MTFDSQHIKSSSNDNHNSLRKKVVVAIAIVLLFGVASHYNSGAESLPTATNNLLRLDTNGCAKNGKHTCLLGETCFTNDDCPFVGPKNTSCCAYYFFSWRSCTTASGGTQCIKHDH